MKLTILIDDKANCDKPMYQSEHGVCYYIETRTERILFDLGYSGLFMRNAYLMGIDTKDVTHICFSHGHNDHTGGLLHWIREYGVITVKPRLIAHPNVFNRKIYDDGEEIGIGIKKDIVATYFEMKLTEEFFEISKNLIFLGQIERYNDFENKISVGKTENGDKGFIDDYCLDDTALIYNAKVGIVIITACSHSGICNIVEYAKKVAQTKWGKEHVHAIIGGLHLLSPSDDLLNKTTNFLKRQNIDRLCIGHCTDFKSKAYMLNAGLNIRELRVGNGYYFEAMHR